MVGVYVFHITSLAMASAMIILVPLQKKGGSVEDITDVSRLASAPTC